MHPQNYYGEITTAIFSILIRILLTIYKTFVKKSKFTLYSHSQASAIYYCQPNITSIQQVKCSFQLPKDSLLIIIYIDRLLLEVKGRVKGDGGLGFPFKQSTILHTNNYHLLLITSYLGKNKQTNRHLNYWNVLSC